MPIKLFSWEDPECHSRQMEPTVSISCKDAYFGEEILPLNSIRVSLFGGDACRPVAARPKPIAPAVAVSATTERPVHCGNCCAPAVGRAGPLLPGPLLRGEEVENWRLQAPPRRLLKNRDDMFSRAVACPELGSRGRSKKSYRQLAKGRKRPTFPGHETRTASVVG